MAPPVFRVPRGPDLFVGAGLSGMSGTGSFARMESLRNGGGFSEKIINFIART